VNELVVSTRVHTEFVEITEGVKPGESVVTTGNHELEDGMAVRSAAAPAAAAAPAQDAS